MFKGKITIVGAGAVGSTTAYTLMLSGLVSEIVLIDKDKNRAEGNALDMNHGISFVNPVKIIAGDYPDVTGSDMVIITAGANQEPGERRTDLLKRNAKIMESIVENVLKYCHDDTIILVVTNPVDILTYVTYKISGFSRNHIIGSGTVLDTARLKYLLGEHANVDVRNVHTYIIGEHGDSEVAAWSTTAIAGMNINDFCKTSDLCDTNTFCANHFYETVKNSAYEIIEKKGATYYAIALSTKRIVESIIGNEKSILTVSSMLDGQYGIKDMCLAVPTLVSSNGAEKVLEIGFSDNEISDLQKSADTLKKLAREIGY